MNTETLANSPAVRPPFIIANRHYANYGKGLEYRESPYPSSNDTIAVTNAITQLKKNILPSAPDKLKEILLDLISHIESLSSGQKRAIVPELARSEHLLYLLQTIERSDDNNNEISEALDYCVKHISGAGSSKQYKSAYALLMLTGVGIVTLSGLVLPGYLLLNVALSALSITVGVIAGLKYGTSAYSDESNYTKSGSIGAAVMREAGAVFALCSLGAIVIAAVVSLAGPAIAASALTQFILFTIVTAPLLLVSTYKLAGSKTRGLAAKVDRFKLALAADKDSENPHRLFATPVVGEATSASTSTSAASASAPASASQTASQLPAEPLLPAPSCSA